MPPRSKEKDESSNEPQVRELKVAGNDTSDYTGVSPEYQNYANKQDKPLVGKGEYEFDNPDTDAPVTTNPSHPQMEGSDEAVQEAREKQKESEKVPESVKPADDDDENNENKNQSNVPSAPVVPGN